MAKTFHVEKFKAWANSQLARKSSSPQEREGIALALERVLHSTDNYRGFTYVEWQSEGGYDNWISDGSPDDNTIYLGDQTRRQYF